MGRVLRAPETSHRVLRRQADATTLHFLLEAAQAELPDRSSVVYPLWTALGDRYFPGSSGHGATEAGEPFVFDRQHPYVAPALGRIVVDP